MKLRNKKTGEIVEGGFILTHYDGISADPQKSLAELNEEWEDYTERKGIQSVGNIANSVHIEYPTEEEADEAVEKLEAWKRLRDKGWKFCGHVFEIIDQKELIGLKPGEFEEGPVGETQADLDLLFGDEE